MYVLNLILFTVLQVHLILYTSPITVSSLSLSY